MINNVKTRLKDLEKNGYPLKREQYIEKNPAREKSLIKKYETLKKIWIACFAVIILGAVENFSNDPVRISIMLCIWWISVAYAIGSIGIQLSENTFIRKNGVKIQAHIIAVTPDEKKKNIVWYAFYTEGEYHVCPGIFAIHCSKKQAEKMKETSHDIWYAKNQWDVVSDRNNLQAIRRFRENIIACLVMILLGIVSELALVVL